MKTDFVEIFQTIRASLQPYATNGFTATTNSETNYELCSEKKIEIGGKKHDGIYFAAVKILKGYVGFYFMPVYTLPEIKVLFKPELLKLLKGESCFQIKKLDDTLMEQINESLAAGFTLYKQKGWV